MCSQHPSLRIYRVHLTLLSAKLSATKPTHNPRYGRAVLRRLNATLDPTDPPHIIYAALLATISHLSPYATPNPSPQSLHDTHAALAAVDDLLERATRDNHTPVVLLAHVLRLRIVVIAGLRDSVAAALTQAENALGVAYPAASTPDDTSISPTAAQYPATSATCQNSQPVIFPIAFDAFMAIHTLIFGVVFHTQVGNAADAFVRLTHLHALLDANVLQKAPHGIVTVRQQFAIHSTFHLTVYRLSSPEVHHLLYRLRIHASYTSSHFWSAQVQSLIP